MTNQATLSEQKQQHAALTGEIADLLLSVEWHFYEGTTSEILESLKNIAKGNG